MATFVAGVHRSGDTGTAQVAAGGETGLKLASGIDQSVEAAKFRLTSLLVRGGKLSIEYGKTVWFAAMTDPLINCSFASTLACKMRKERQAAGGVDAAESSVDHRTNMIAHVAKQAFMSTTYINQYRKSCFVQWVGIRRERNASRVLLPFSRCRQKVGVDLPPSAEARSIFSPIR